VEHAQLASMYPGHIPALSFHCPPDCLLWRDIPGFESAYAPEWQGHYFADSRGAFLYGDPEDSDVRPLQINLHPEHWFPATSATKGSGDERSVGSAARCCSPSPKRILRSSAGVRAMSCDHRWKCDGFNTDHLFNGAVVKYTDTGAAQLEGARHRSLESAWAQRRERKPSATPSWQSRSGSLDECGG
jgi:hypothetical protein